ncbi:MAG: hypothetical protein U9Q62_06865 [Campylobacterota bacterium]|nr:hypothetical protein [Campylobacterota bacterium]
MTLTRSGSTITIDGNIKSIQDFQEIKNAVDTITTTGNSVEFILDNSMSMTSSVIGYINKVIQKDGVRVSMKVSDERLYGILKDLNLVNVFNVRIA